MFWSFQSTSETLRIFQMFLEFSKRKRIIMCTWISKIIWFAKHSTKLQILFYFWMYPKNMKYKEISTMGGGVCNKDTGKKEFWQSKITVGKSTHARRKFCRMCDPGPKFHEKFSMSRFWYQNKFWNILNRNRPKILDRSIFSQFIAIKWLSPRKFLHGKNSISRFSPWNTFEAFWINSDQKIGAKKFNFNFSPFCHKNH